MKAPLPSPLGDDSPIVPLGLHVYADAVTIAYRCSFWGELRNHLAFTVLHPSAAALIVGAATVFTLLSNHVFLLGNVENPLLRWSANYLFLLLVNIVVSIVNIVNARDAQRGETTTLRRERLEYISPVKTRLIPWNKVKFILGGTGFLFFVRADGVTYVPDESFASPQARRLFLGAARTLHKSRGAEWPAEAVAQFAALEPGSK